jgi:hypothetical protein
MMKYWTEELALTEAAAIRIESLEQAAETRFDRVFESAQAGGNTGVALQTDEFRDWMQARADTDAAWGRWAAVMDAKPRPD